MLSIVVTTGSLSVLKNGAGIIFSSNAPFTHFLSQKVENAPMWALVKVSAVLAAQGATESIFLFCPDESFL